MSRKRKYSDEFRLKVVLEYLSGTTGGFDAVANKYGMDRSMLRRWVHAYEKHGSDGLFRVLGTYSGEFKIYVVEYMHNNSLSLREAASHFCIPSVPTISKWERIYYEEGPKALLEERREVQRLRMENEYLKKLNALVLEREKSEQKKK